MFGERLTDSHIWRHSLASRQVVDDLVAREEHHCVGVVLERFDNCKGTIDIANVIALPWCRPINTFSSPVLTMSLNGWDIIKFKATISPTMNPKKRIKNK